MMYHIPNPDHRAKMAITEIEREYINRSHGNLEPFKELENKIDKYCERLITETRVTKKAIHFDETQAPSKTLKYMEGQYIKYYQRCKHGLRLSKLEEVNGVKVWLSIVGEGAEVKKTRHNTKEAAEAESFLYNKKKLDQLRVEIDEMRGEKNGKASD